jgi:glutathione S-transferase
MSVPTLKYNEEVLTDTSKIVNHLIEKNPGKLMPNDPADRAKVEAYASDIFSKFLHIDAFTLGHMSQQSMFKLYHDTIPTNLKLQKMREDPEMR